MNEVQLPSTINRRRMLAGSAAAAAIWSAPAITSMDRVAAAVGSCGVKPLQVDLSRWAGAALPGTFTSDDGSVTLTQTINDPSGVGNATYTGNVYNGTLNGRTHPVLLAMSGASLGVGQSMTITFSTPVRPSFFLVDVDRGTGGWEDTVQIQGSLGGGTPFSPGSLTVGTHAIVVPPDTVRGTASSNNSQSNVEVDFDQLVDTITISHTDLTAWTGFQWIGIHDFHWC